MNNSIEELTGIKSEAFPYSTYLEGGQWEALPEAIFKVFDAFCIELVDKPEDLPPELLYDFLTTNWDYLVQFLPVSGFDLELCFGHLVTCDYGEFCACNKAHNFQEGINAIIKNFD